MVGDQICGDESTKAEHKHKHGDISKMMFLPSLALMLRRTIRFARPAGAMLRERLGTRIAAARASTLAGRIDLAADGKDVPDLLTIHLHSAQADIADDAQPRTDLLL